MGTRCFGIFAISTILLFIATRDTICEESTTISTKKMIETSNDSLSIDPLKKLERPCKGHKCLKYWMSVMGYVQDDLVNIQAMIVKDEDVKGPCDKATRHSQRRHLVCAGSILNRNHVLTSAACLHTASHIRHNIRGGLAVVIAPLKPTIQVIRVIEYKVHHGHTTNPYSQTYLKHNLAILQLACRIDMDNFHKIELPQVPFIHTCSEENCLVMIHRKIRRTNYVMYQIVAPHVPLPNRRRKETMIKDSELRKFIQYENSSILNFENRRFKRKSAEVPIFVGGEARTDGADVVSSNLTENWTFENLSVDNLTTMTRSISDAFGHVGDKTIRSIVVRSSDGHRACAQTGAPVMLNKTQAAVVAVPCDDRQPYARWGYTDLFDNLDWIHDILQDWNTSVSASIMGQPGVANGHEAASGGSGNFSTCSTCIFNFFIEIGCKDKNKCGNKSITNGQHQHLMPDPRKSATTRSKSQRCSDSNRLGIELGIGQGCEKGNENSQNRPEYRENWAKSLNTEVSGRDERKESSLPIARSSEIGKLDQPVTIDPNKKIVVKDRSDDGDKITRKENPRSSIERKIGNLPSSISRNRETSKSEDKNPERENEIGLQNIEGDSTDWLAEVEKGLEMSEVNRSS